MRAAWCSGNAVYFPVDKYVSHSGCIQTVLSKILFNFDISILQLQMEEIQGAVTINPNNNFK